MNAPKLKGYAQECKQDAAFLWREAWRVVRRHRAAYIGLPLLVLVAAVFLFPYDPIWNHWLSTNGRVLWLYLAAGEFSSVGDFVEGTLMLILLIWGLGAVCRQRPWRRAAVACLLAAALAGGAANIPRFLVGRPRPHMELPDRPIGPTLDSDMQSFPSGHSATALATVTSLSFAFPAISVPLMLTGGLVAFCRVYVNAHYLTDILVGCTIGLWFGSIFGIAFRHASDGNERRNRREGL